jgi:predicted kinase
MKQTLILVCGLPGSGKSFFSKQFAEQNHISHFNSDIVRKQLFPTLRTYSELEKQQVYDWLITQTRVSLKAGKSVLIDATFYKKSLRTPFYDIASELNIPIKIIHIYATETLIKERTSAVRMDSEADYSVYLKLKNAFEPIDEHHLVLQSTNNNVDSLLTEADSFLKYE